MSGFEPGEGWRRLAKGERDQDEMIVHYSDEGSTTWVRVVPVPPLPTEPYTIINAKHRGGHSGDLILGINHRWMDTRGDTRSAEETAASVISFEVLAEPRAVTAKAVLDRVREFYTDMNRPWVGYATAEEIVAREFGVEL